MSPDMRKGCGFDFFDNYTAWKKLLHSSTPAENLNRNPVVQRVECHLHLWPQELEKILS